MGAGTRLEVARDEAVSSSGEPAGEDGERHGQDRRRRRERGADDGGSERPDEELPGDADVEEPGLEAQADRESAKHEWCRVDERVQ